MSLKRFILLGYDKLNLDNIEFHTDSTRNKSGLIILNCFFQIFTFKGKF